MADDRFRRQLDRELNGWVAHGLLEEPQRQQLRRYYELDRLDQNSGGRFVAVLMTLGALLVGLGIITFIAANWAVIPRGIRATTAFSLMVGLQALGFWLWRDPDRLPGLRKSQQLGSALLLMGGLAMGAAIALMAQWVQIGGSPGGLFLAWGLGVLAMAYGIRHTPSGFLSIVLWLIGFWSQLYADFDPREMLLPYAPAQFPLATLILFLPLAYWCRSRWIFAAGAIALFASLGWLTVGLQYRDAGEIFLLVFVIGIAGVWAWSFWHERWRPWLSLRLKLEEETDDHAEQQAGLDLAPTAQLLALLSVIGLLYVLGFRGADLDLDWEHIRSFQIGMFISSLLTLLFFLLVTVGLWVGNFRFQQALPAALSPGMQLLDRGVGLCCLLVPLLVLSSSLPDADGVSSLLQILGGNLALFGLGSVIAWQGLQQATRWRFWLGLLTLTLLVISRFFEYPTGLLLKSVVLVCCGVAVILAGLRFERMHQRIHRQSPLPPSLHES